MKGNTHLQRVDFVGMGKRLIEFIEEVKERLFGGFEIDLLDGAVWGYLSFSEIISNIENFHEWMMPQPLSIELMWQAHLVFSREHPDNTLVRPMLNHDGLQILDILLGYKDPWDIQPSNSRRREALKKIEEENAKQPKDVIQSGWGIWNPQHYLPIILQIAKEQGDRSYLAQMPVEILQRAGKFTSFPPCRSISEEDRTEFVEIAKLAKECERYEECLATMTIVIRSGKPLSKEERNTFSVAAKNSVSQKRAAHQNIMETERTGKEKGEPDWKIRILRRARRQIADEISQHVERIISLIGEIKLPLESKELTDRETTAFFEKMLGDQLRYLGELHASDRELGDPEAEEEKRILEEKEVLANAERHYKNAIELIKGSDPLNCVLLGTYLNYSVFLYELKHDVDEACRVAKDAFDKGLEALDHAACNGTYQDHTVILQLLRDNLTLWVEEQK